MIHTPADEVLLTLVVLRRLVVVPGLLLLWGLPLSTVVDLAWTILDIPLGTTIGIVSRCYRSKPTGEQRQATRGAGRFSGLLVGPGPSVNGPEVRHMP
jgi:hypothetical protein